MAQANTEKAPTLRQRMQHQLQLLDSLISRKAADLDTLQKRRETLATLRSELINNPALLETAEGLFSALSEFGLDV